MKGLDDWKKYLRGKFFEEEKTISLWYRMVSFLNGNKVKPNESYKVMTEAVKGILYWYNDLLLSNYTLFYLALPFNVNSIQKTASKNSKGTQLDLEINGQIL